MQPYVAMISNENGNVGCLPIPILPDGEPIDNFLILKPQMQLVVLVCLKAGSYCAGLGVIEECSPKDV